ncbi:MAG: hypothetical protein WKG32_02965 [Gemmatimonadaceae bacterium]
MMSAAVPRSEQLAGVPLEILVSDPWEVVSENGAGPFRGSVISVAASHFRSGKHDALIQLNSPLQIHGVRCDFVLATARHAEDDIAVIEVGHEVFCSLSGLTAKEVEMNSLASGWRSGRALIGTLKWV